MNVFNNYNCTHICFHLQLSNLRLHIWLSSGYFCKFIIHENTPDILQKMKWYGYFDFILYCKLHVVHVKTRHVTAVNRHFSFKLSGSSVILFFVPRTVQDQSVWIQVHHLVWYSDVMHGGLLFVHKVHIRDPDPLHDFCVKFYDVNTVRFVVL